MTNQTSQPLQAQDATAYYLARELADEENTDKYLVCCRKYPYSVIHQAFRKAQSFPAHRIRKSRAAIFFYFVKQYAHELPESPRN